MRTKSLPKTFWWLNHTQFAGAMNDNVFKLLMTYALVSWNEHLSSAKILGSVGLAFALPFLLIVPIAGNFADRFSKRDMIVKLKGLEIFVMAFGVTALALQSSPMLYATMFLMSAQSAFFGPCKMGIIPEHIGSEKLSRANGLLQLFTFVAIIAGTVLAPELSLLADGRFALAATTCLAIAIMGFLASRNIAPSPAHPERKISFNGFGSVWKTLAETRKDGYLTLAIFGIAVFLLCAAFVQLNILPYGEEHLGLSPEQSTRLFLLTAIGIGIGSTTAGWLSGRSIEFGIVPIGAGIIALSLFVLGVAPEGSILISAAAMVSIGFAGGLFMVPLQAFIQYRSPKERIGSIQAASGFVGWIGIALASQLVSLNSSTFGFSAQSGFLYLSFGLFAIAVFSLWILPDFFSKFVVMLITRFCYRLRVRGLENLPAFGPALLVCNHVSLMDAILVVSSQQRRIRMLMSRGFYEKSNWFVRKIVDIADVILIHENDGPKKLIQSLKSARAALDEGYLVCIFAEGTLTRTGMTRPFKPGFERIVKGTNHPIIPVYIGGAWGSVASYYQGNPKIQLHRDFRYPVSVHFGKELPSSSTSFEVQQAVCELSGDSFEVAKEDRKSLGREFIESARRNWDKLAIADSSGKELKFGELLIASLILRGRLQAHFESSERNIGILLPTGSGSALANLATTLDKRVTVNLNYTAPSASVESAIDQCEIKTVITSRAFLEHVPTFELPNNIIYLEDVLQNIAQTEKLWAYAKARFSPLSLLLADGDISPDDTATIMFSSGSTAEPKGIMLSHHNLISNIESFRSVVPPKPNDAILATLPFFHSFGYTVTFWYPLLSGVAALCHTNPLEGETIGKLSEKFRASILLTTPSFLLAYARKIRPEQFAHLRLVFTGAEKLQPRVAQIFEKKFGVQPLEGYGATELAPVCAVGLPNVNVGDLDEQGNRENRIGRVLPGMCMRIEHPDTRETLPPGEEGLIMVKGPNVMRGYLNKEELTRSVVCDGWYDTGDIGVMDTDGFFAITGRQSRFSKLAGEMISHGSVEKALQDALGLGSDALCVVAIPDDKRGEKLCVVHTQLPFADEQLREKLKSLDIPNLWKPTPRNWTCVDSLPLLGTGKLDFRTMKEIAEGVKQVAV